LSRFCNESTPCCYSQSRSPRMSSNSWSLSSATASTTNVPTSKTCVLLFLMPCRAGFRCLAFKDVPSKVTVLLKSKRHRPQRLAIRTRHNSWKKPCKISAGWIEDGGDERSARARPRSVPACVASGASMISNRTDAG